MAAVNARQLTFALEIGGLALAVTHRGCGPNSATNETMTCRIACRIAMEDEEAVYEPGFGDISYGTVSLMCIFRFRSSQYHPRCCHVREERSGRVVNVAEGHVVLVSALDAHEAETGERRLRLIRPYVSGGGGGG